MNEAFDCLSAQTYANYEVIVADDSGTALSREIVEARARTDARIRYRPNAKTMGIAASLVEAVKSARGEFIAILNDDDRWEKCFLAEVTAPLEADANCVLSFCDHWIMRADGRVDDELSNTFSREFKRATLPAGRVAQANEFCAVTQGVPIAFAAAFRKDAVDWALVTPQVTGAYDFWIACLLARTGKPIHYTPKRMAFWRQHEQMETRRRSHDKGENLIYIYATMLEQGWFPELRQALRAKLGEALLVAAREKLHFDRTQEARRYFWRDFCLSHRPAAAAGMAVACLPRFARVWLKGMLNAARNQGNGSSP